MFEWLLAILLLAAFLLVLPRMLAGARKSARKGGGGGFVVGLGMILASVFDPARGAATEEIDRRRENETGEEEAGGPPR